MKKMLKRNLFVLVILVLISMLVSCAVLRIENFSDLHKGMSKKKAIEAIGSAPENEYVLEDKIDGKDVVGLHYIVSQGQQNIMWIVIIPIPLKGSEHDSDYFLLFADGKLLSWGYPHEFQRSHDLFISEAGTKLMEQHLMPKDMRKKKAVEDSSPESTE